MSVSFLLLFIQFSLCAQVGNKDYVNKERRVIFHDNPAAGDTVAENDKPIIEGDAFDRMVTQGVTYAITGENVPTSGVKVDVTKATSTLSGFIDNDYGPDILVDIGVGVTEGAAALFDSRENLHSDFSATVGFVFTPKKSKARMYPVAANIIRTSRQKYKTHLYTNKTDSLLVVLLILNGHKLKLDDGSVFNPESYLNEQLAENKKAKEAVQYIRSVMQQEKRISANGFTPEDTIALSATQKQLLRELTKRYFSTDINTKVLLNLYTALPNVRGRSDLMLSDLISTMNSIISGRDQNINYQIKLADKYWTVKSLKWYTVLPFVRRQGLSLHELNALDRQDTSSFTFGLGARFNQIIHWKKGVFYWKIGADAFRANNLTDFTKVKFLQQDSITSNGGKYLYSEKEGSSYTGAVLDHDFGFGISVEAYLFYSRKNFIPGLYFKSDFIHSNVLKNNKTASIEFGFPFNINSPDKSKSVVSIVPYMRFPYLYKPADDPEITDEIESDDYQIGLRIGLPVSIASKPKN